MIVRRMAALGAFALTLAAGTAFAGEPLAGGPGYRGHGDGYRSQAYETGRGYVTGQGYSQGRYEQAGPGEGYSGYGGRYGVSGQQAERAGYFQRERGGAYAVGYDDGYVDGYAGGQGSSYGPAADGGYRREALVDSRAQGAGYDERYRTTRVYEDPRRGGYDDRAGYGDGYGYERQGYGYSTPWLTERSESWDYVAPAYGGYGSGYGTGLVSLNDSGFFDGAGGVNMDGGGYGYGGGGGYVYYSGGASASGRAYSSAYARATATTRVSIRSGRWHGGKPGKPGKPGCGCGGHRK